MSKFKMYMCGDGVTHEFATSSLSSYIKFVEDKGFSIERIPPLDNSVLLSGSKEYDYFFIVDNGVKNIDSIFDELNSIYSYLPRERSKNNKYMLVKRNDLEFVVNQDTLEMFSISEKLAGKKVDGFEIILTDLSFTEAYNLFKEIMYRQIVSKR